MGRSSLFRWALLALLEVAGFCAVLLWWYGNLLPAVESRLIFVATMLVSSAVILVASWLQSGGRPLRFALSTLLSLVLFWFLGSASWILVLSWVGDSAPAGWAATFAIWTLLVFESLGIAAAIPALLERAYTPAKPAARHGTDVGDPA